MGALHAGHLSLVERSKRENDLTVMSIFVNPTQFGPQEDFENYPRTFHRDEELAAGARVDILFHPSTHEIYSSTASTWVEESHFSLPFCGPFRLGHFRGVATVVLKLLQMAQPNTLYLGQKDAQQLRVIEKMVDDLDVPVQVIGCPTLREADGLAMSSRNAYLTPAEREVAPLLHSALQKGFAAFQKGERSTEIILSITHDTIDKNKIFRLQYLELRRWSDFETVERVEEKSLLALAAYLGKTRLIDNLIFGDEEI